MRLGKLFIFHLIAIFICLPIIIPVHGADEMQVSDAGQNPFIPHNSIDEVHKKIDAIENDISIMTSVQKDRTIQTFGVEPKDIEKRLLNLGYLKSSYERFLNSIVSLDKMEQAKAAISESFRQYQTKGMTQQAPYPLSFLDTIQEALSAIEAEQKNLDLTIEMLRKEISDHTQAMQAAERELKQIKEKQNLSEGGGKKSMNWQVDELGIVLENHKVVIQTISNEIRRHELHKNNNTDQILLYQEQLAYVTANVRYNEEDLKRQIAVIQQKKNVVLSEIERFRNELPAIEKQWLEAQNDLTRPRQSDEFRIAEAYLNARSEWRKTYQVVLELKESALLLLDRHVQVWKKRYDLIGGKLLSDNLEAEKKEVENNLSNLNRLLQMQQEYLTSIQKQIGVLEGRLSEEGLHTLIRRHLLTQIEAIRKRLDRRLEYQSVIIGVDQVERRLLAEIEKKIGHPALKEHFTDIKKDLIKFWNIEIWTVDNHSVTLKKVAIALFILAVGMIIAKFFLAMIYTRFLAKSQLKETTASAVHKILSYSAYLLVCLFALRIVNIPLTAFAFLGGAVAIGIGFGAQNLLNNFISGFMILGERPINIGDLIEVDGVLGMVEEIGTRCTRVRTGENIHILVPNSSFLEKNIINWTLSDKNIRANVVVGVAYGSPVRKVEELLLKAAKQVPRVMSRPEPFVLFTDFGDNALTFYVYFWVSIHRVIERRQIESDVRFNIDDIFNKEGIVIAFPQRDVHFDNDSPLQISITNTATKIPPNDI